MNDELNDIDPLVVEAVLANADAFIDLDAQVDDIIAWGENELKTKQLALAGSETAIEEFKIFAAEIEQQVADKLSRLENDVKEQYKSPEL